MCLCLEMVPCNLGIMAFMLRRTLQIDTVIFLIQVLLD